MASTKNLVLNREEVALKIQRIAWELYEKHLDADTLYIVGIAKSGYWLAQQISEKLQQIATLKVHLLEMEINKRDPLNNAIHLSIDGSQLNGSSVVLVDDVLNSGKVLIYGIKYLLDYQLKKLTTAVLVDRNHKRYPVKADVKGLSLSTSLNEHVEVQILNGQAEVYLT